MAIRYNVKNVTDAFTGLVESLDSLSNLPPDSGVFENRERDLVNAIDLRPDMGRIRATFERAIKVAHRARDVDTEAALREQLSELQTTHEELTRGEKTEREYKSLLADVAASVRGLLADIAEDGTKKADTTQTPAANKPTTIVIVAKPPRTDKGKAHCKAARGWRTQADMAADFSKSAKKICGKWYGKVTVAIVKDWETRYPDETKRERKSGYHAGLRNEPNPTPETKKAYCEAAANWNDYWKKHNAAFLTWLKTNPQGDHATFLKTWERPGKTVHRNDTDKTMRYGADTSLPDALDSGDFDNET